MSEAQAIPVTTRAPWVATPARQVAHKSETKAPVAAGAQPVRSACLLGGCSWKTKAGFSPRSPGPGKTGSLKAGGEPLPPAPADAGHSAPSAAAGPESCSGCPSTCPPQPVLEQGDAISLAAAPSCGPSTAAAGEEMRWGEGIKSLGKGGFRFGARLLMGKGVGGRVGDPGTGRSSRW